MDDIRLKFYSPIVTGKPVASLDAIKQQKQNAQTENSFQSILQEKINQNSEVSFSKHAVKRTIEHNIELTDESLARLNEGVRLASERNLDDTLILVGGTAFVVNVKNNTVITAMENSEIQGNVFTNINGTVII
ncbi:TIGR02530 family flagellar biosynthesis protein [Scatolibacter rhodanostii]|uniref:TIGR02530 family flagellar biosynthesis protein n=1 Tax=Scatolibacter rhodanostii TaxID=2014781 RepID=UPI000C078569|nr:TIGR02530 family flagellar biosynthesis protein [Scatolibacter rhodanostii]